MAISAALLLKLKRRYGTENIARWSNPGVADYSSEDTDVISEALDDVEGEIFEELVGTEFDETDKKHVALAVDAIALYMKSRATERGLRESEWNSINVRARALRQVTNANRLIPGKALAAALSGRNKEARYSDDRKLNRLGINGKNSPTGTSTGERF